MGQCNAGQRKEKHGHTQALPELGPNNIAHIHSGIKISAPMKVKANVKKLAVTRRRISMRLPNLPNRGQQDRKKAHRRSRKPAHVAV